MCFHDPQYRIEHEQAGGVGCPLCNAAASTPPAAVCHCGAPLDSGDNECSACDAEWQDYLDEASMSVDML